MVFGKKSKPVTPLPPGQPSPKAPKKLPDIAKPPDKLPKPPCAPKKGPDITTPAQPPPQPKLPCDKIVAQATTTNKMPPKTKAAKPPAKTGRWPWRWCKKKPPSQIKDCKPAVPAAPVLVDQTPQRQYFFPMPTYPTPEVGFRKWCRFCNYLFFITLGLFTLFYLIGHSPIGCLKQALCRMLSGDDTEDRSTETPPPKKKKCPKPKALKIKDDNDTAEMKQQKKCCNYNTDPPLRICKVKKPPNPPPPPSKSTLTPEQCRKILAEENKCKKEKNTVVEVAFEEDDDANNADDDLDDDQEYCDESPTSIITIDEKILKKSKNSCKVKAKSKCL